MEKKWTPGPWEWDGQVWDYDKENEAPWLVGVDDGPIVLLGGIECTSKANAHLIAAAPELYEALEKVFEVMKDDMPVGLRKVAWDAMEKARGE